VPPTGADDATSAAGQPSVDGLTDARTPAQETRMGAGKRSRRPPAPRSFASTARQKAVVRASTCLALWLAGFALGCRSGAPVEIEGTPAGGPYRVTLAVEPAPPRAGVEATLTLRVRDARSGEPVPDLQVVHERVLHTFVVSHDFRHFGHVHHEDFVPLGDDDLARATFRIPHAFPRAGGYRIVTELTHRDRTWLKRFELGVEGEREKAPPPLVPRSEFRAGGRVFRLSAVEPPRAGRTTELVCRIETEAGEPVTDLAMVLGSEAHMATWRADGAHFGHTHAWTPEMAAAMAAMAHHGGHDPSAGMPAMVASGVQHFHGPEIPLRHVFPEPGLYAVFLDLAPGGERTTASFVLEVGP
jgi:hypothetical protein